MVSISSPRLINSRFIVELSLSNISTPHPVTWRSIFSLLLLEQNRSRLTSERNAKVYDSERRFIALRYFRTGRLVQDIRTRSWRIKIFFDFKFQSGVNNTSNLKSLTWRNWLVQVRIFDITNFFILITAAGRKYVVKSFKDKLDWRVNYLSVWLFIVDILFITSRGLCSIVQIPIVGKWLQCDIVMRK